MISQKWSPCTKFQDDPFNIPQNLQYLFDRSLPTLLKMSIDATWWCWIDTVDEAKQTQSLIQSNSTYSRHCMARFLGKEIPRKHSFEISTHLWHGSTQPSIPPGLRPAQPLNNGPSHSAYQLMKPNKSKCTEDPQRCLLPDALPQRVRINMHYPN